MPVRVSCRHNPCQPDKGPTVLTCQKCGELLTESAHAAGVCLRCGAVVSKLSAEQTLTDSAFDSHSEVPVSECPAPVQAVGAEATEFCATIMEDDAAPQPEKIPSPTRMTNDAELDEPMRTLIEEEDDRTIGMEAEENAFATRILSTIDPDAAIVTEANLTSDAESLPRSQLLKSKSDTSTTEPTIPPRSVIRCGDSTATSNLNSDYQIVKILGQGGMGTVWKAVQSSLNREVAIKQISEDTLRSLKEQKSHARIEKYRQAFLAEAVITAELEHPNIIPVHDLGTDAAGDRLYSMKLLRGSSWDRVIDDKTEEENLDILRKVCEAMAFAHEKGIVHRDLKPANIMVGDHGEVLVVDWGTAFPLPHFPKASIVSITSGRAGTPTYMAPEQTEADPSLTGTHTDIYLLGAILFEIATGHAPHPSRTSAGQSMSSLEVMKLASENVIIDVEQTGELLEIARKAMQRSPRDRYASVGQFLDALKSYQKHTESIQLVRQANVDLETANASQDYSMFARSMYGFENAQKLWQANHDAATGLRHARLEYAKAALEKKDYDLGLTLVSEDHPSERDTCQKLRHGREERKKQLARGLFYRKTAAALLVMLFAGGTVAGIWINNERQIAIEAAKSEEIAKNAAVVAKDDALQAKDEAVKAKEAEELAKNEAVKLAVSEKQAKEDAVQAKEAEEKAKDKAVMLAKSETIAKENAVKAAAAERIANQKFIREWYGAQLQLADRHANANAFDSARDTLQLIHHRIDSDLRTEQELTPEQVVQQKALHAEILPVVQRLDAICRSGNTELIARTSGSASIPLSAAAASGQTLVTANIRGEVQLWSAVTRQKSWDKPLKVNGEPRSMALSPNNQLLAIGDHLGQITLWDVATGEPRGELTGHTDEVTRLIFLPDGRLASTSRDKSLQLWNVTDKTSTVLRGHPGGVLSVAPVTDSAGALLGLVTGGDDRQVRFWAMSADGRGRSTIVGRSEQKVTAVAAVPIDAGAESVLLCWGDELGDLRAVELSFAKIRATKPGEVTAPQHAYRLTSQSINRHVNGVTALMIDPVNPRRLISVGGDNLVRTWKISPDELALGQGLLRTLRGHGNAIVDAAAWKDSTTGTTRLLTVSTDGTARLWEPEGNDETGPMGDKIMDRGSSSVSDVLSLSVGGGEQGRLMAVSRDGSATLWNLADAHHPVHLDEGHRFLTQSAILLQDYLVTVSFDGTAAVWNTNTNAMVEKWPDIGTTGVLAGSTDARYIVTGYSPPADTPRNRKYQDNLQIWSLDLALEGRPLAEVRRTLNVGVHTKDDDLPASVAISTTGQRALIGTDHGYLQLVQLDTGGITEPLAAHPMVRNSNQRVPDGVTGVAFLSDSEVATTGLDGWLRFWTIENGKLLPHPARPGFEHRDSGSQDSYRVLGLVASDDGRTLATLARSPTKAKGTPDSQRRNKPQIWVTAIIQDNAELIARIQPEGDSEERVRSLALSGDGQKLLAAISSRQNIAEGNRKRNFLREWTLNGEADLPQADVLLAADNSEFAQAVYASQENHNRIIVSGDALTTMWERKHDQDGFQHRVAAFGPVMAMHACDLSGDGTLAVTVSHDLATAVDDQAFASRLRGEVRLWRVSETAGQRIGAITLDGAVNAVAICPTDSDLILVGGFQRAKEGGYSAELYRWNGKTLEKVDETGTHDKPIMCVRFSANGQRLITVADDASVHVLDRVENRFHAKANYKLANLQPELRLGELTAADLSDDGQLLAVADKRAAVIVDVDTGKPVVSELLQGHANDLTDVRFAVRTNIDAPPRLWSTSLDGSIKYWALPNRENGVLNAARPLLTLRGHQQGVLALAVLPDGGVVSGGNDGRVILWPTSKIEATPED